MRPPVGPTPVEFARELSERLEHQYRTDATPAQIARAKEFLQARRRLRHQAPTRRGYEYVVEILSRPTITNYALGMLRAPTSDSHLHVYSSHFHTTTDSESEWEAKWVDFTQAHPDVDTDDDGHSRRADLFIAVSNLGLVSVEFKYLRPRVRPAVQACVSQIRQHLTKHGACLLVIYSAIPVSSRLNDAISDIRREISKGHGFVVQLAGPEITFQ